MTSPQDDGAGPAAWASPGGAPAPTGGSAPSTTGAAPDATGTTPGWGQPPAPPTWGSAPAAAPPGGWRLPALQPGIIPLRPLGLGEVLDGAVRAIRANPGVMFGLSAVVVTVAVALQTLVQLYVTSLLGPALADLPIMGDLSSADSAAMAESLSTSGGQVLTAPLLVPVTSVLTGLLIVSVSRSVLGQRVPLREVWRSRRVWLVVGFGLLQLVVPLVVVAAWLAGVVALVVAGYDGAAVGVGLVGGLGLFAASVWLTARTLLVAPALMLEGKRFWPTVARAWRLTRGSFWRLLGIYLLSNLLVTVLMYLFVMPAAVLAGILTVTSGDDTLTVLASALGQVVGLTLSTTFLAAVVALLYVDVRIRREGLDLELARAAAGQG